MYWLTMKLHILFLLLFVMQFRNIFCQEFGFKDLVFVILSQRDPVHEREALILEADIKTQTLNQSTVYLSHRDFKEQGDWTVIPLLEKLWNLLKGKFKWLLFCSEQTKFNVEILLSEIYEYNSEEAFIGRALQDSQPTIIHHFASVSNFKYPLFASGFGLNHNLMQRLMTSIDKNKFKEMDFSIDASHELAVFLKNNLKGTALIHNSKFCIEHKENCATYITTDNFCETSDIKGIFFAIKTCKKFHENRVPIVLATWAKESLQKAFFSDTYDKDIPTVRLNAPNSESGHCAKTEAILHTMRRYMINDENLQWVLLSDDDTILSVRRIEKLAACYDPGIPYVIGERYGYRVSSRGGYNYITGGGGALLSRGAIMKLTESSCTCPSDDTPDDMFFLGMCVLGLNITLVHNPSFHQARPDDYNSDYLKIREPISFHKHWMTDPIKIYEFWFKEADLDSEKHVHTEL